jgi:hypothetical protein
LAAWVNTGGRYIGWRGGAALAARTGLTTATLSPSSAGIPGSLIRARVDDASPLAQGVGDIAYAFWEFDDIMDAARDDVVMRFPDVGTEDFFISGFADGEEELSGTAAVTDEAVGSGRVVLFTFDPNFRAFTDGTQMLWNAILGPPPTTAPALRAGSQERATAESSARRAARSLSDLQAPITVVVPRSDAAKTEALLGRGAIRGAQRRGPDDVLDSEPARARDGRAPPTRVISWRPCARRASRWCSSRRRRPFVLARNVL